MPWQGNSLVCPGLAHTIAAAVVCVHSDNGLYHQRLETRVLECWRNRNSDYGKKDLILNFMLSTTTLSVTKTIVNFWTWAKRCCVLWLPTKSLFSDTEGVEGDVCERVHVHTHKNKNAQNFHLTGAGSPVPRGGDTALQMAVLRLHQFPSWAALWLMTINCSGSHLKFTFHMVGDRAVALSSVGHGSSCTGSPCRAPATLATPAHAAMQLKRQERKTDQVFYSKRLKS